MSGGRTGLAAALFCSTLLAAAPPSEAGSLWRPKRQVRSLEAGDPLARQIFGRARRRAWRAARREPPAAAAVDVEGWLSRWGPAESSEGGDGAEPAAPESREAR